MAKRTRRGFGGLRKLPSGRWQANYTGRVGLIHKAPRTFDAKDDGVGWLNQERRLIDMDVWTPPAARNAERAPALTLGDVAERWYAQTVNRHKPRTRSVNRGYLDRLILPELGAVPIDELTTTTVREWYAGLDSSYPARNSNAYSLLRTILNQAVDDALIGSNPARIKGAAVKHRERQPVALSGDEIRALAAAMSVERYRALVLLAAVSGLRFGEVTALRRRDLVLSDEGCHVTVTRAVVRLKGEYRVDRPKSRAALRTVPLPSGLRDALEDHLERFSASGRDGLVFPACAAEFLPEATVRAVLKAAAKDVGHPDLRFHDLRHTAATRFARAGATLADLMVLMGWTSAAMAGRYTHATDTRNRALAETLW